MLTINFIPLKLRFFHFMIILAMLFGVSKLPVFIYWISPLLLTLEIMLFSWISVVWNSRYYIELVQILSFRPPIVR